LAVKPFGGSHGHCIGVEKGAVDALRRGPEHAVKTDGIRGQYGFAFGWRSYDVELDDCA